MVIGMTDEWVIFQPRGFGVCQTGLPDSTSTASIRAALPAGARMTRLLSISGHCPAYHGGTSVPYWRTRSRPQRSSPLVASAHRTWHLGPNATTNWPATAGTVRDMPWLRFTESG